MFEPRKSSALNDAPTALPEAALKLLNLVKRRKWFRNLDEENKRVFLTIAGEVCQCLASAFGYSQSEYGLFQAYSDLTRALELNGRKITGAEYLNIFLKLYEKKDELPTIVRLSLLKSVLYRRKAVSEINNLLDLLVAKIYPLISRELAEISFQDLTIVYEAHERLNKIVSSHSASDLRLNTYHVDAPFLFAYIYYIYMRAGYTPSVVRVANYIQSCDEDWLIGKHERLNLLRYRLMWQRLRTDT